MAFWRKKKNIVEQENEASDQALLHPENEPEIEPSTDYEASLAVDDEIQAELHVKDNDVIEELVVTPVPDAIPEIAKGIEEEPDDDHSQEERSIWIH